jgi:ELWxxDGT repeat protein
MTKAAVVLVSLLALAGAATAQTPARVKDINLELDGGTGDPISNTTFVEMGGAAYFQVTDGIHGTELWRSDGTAAGTVLVRDICPGICSSVPQFLTAVGDELYFDAYDGVHGFELWKSDGTAAGTVLVEDIAPGRDSAFPTNLLRLDGTLLFLANRNELWRSDGTEPGTMLVKLFEEGESGPRPLAQAGGIVFLAAEDDDHGRELWKTDGTTAGTLLVRDIYAGPNASLNLSGIENPGIQDFLALGNRFFFVASDGFSDYELWVSDGTEAGTALVKDLGPETYFPAPCCLAELNGLIFFSARGRLWKTDGSEANTVMVKEITPPPGWSSDLRGLTVAGSWVYFGALGSELWKSDGSEENTVLVKDIQPGAGSGSLFSLRANGTEVVFFANDGTSGMEPWRSDGTEAGTLRLADLNPGAGNSHPSGMYLFLERETVVAGRWFFRADDGQGDIEVYVSDGSPAGTSKLKEINSQTSAFPSFWFFGLDSTSMADKDGTLFFSAKDDSSGEELWKSDGTESGTVRIADIRPGTAGSTPYEITALGDRVLFGASGLSVNNSSQLWISDGTEAGTTLVLDRNPSELEELNGHVFLSASHGSYFNFWKSDGTPAGTSILGSGSASGLTQAGDLLFYGSSDGSMGSLWRTDGNPDGTFQLASGYPDALTPWGSRVFFALGNEVHRPLWVSDGTSAGTHPVKTFDPGSGIPPRSFPFLPTPMARAGQQLFFLASEPSTGEELWVSDGAGAVPVRDIFPGPHSSEITWLTSVGNNVYFVAEDGTHGHELWVSDGTALGTWIVADLVPGEGSSLPEQLKAVGRNLVFSAHTPDHGLEPWITDGTMEGTRLLADLAPGPIPSSPRAFTFSGPWLYFTATDGETGFELYSVPWSELDGGADFYTLEPCRLLDTRTSSGALTGGSPRTVQVAGTCGIPVDAVAIAVNLTAITPTAAGSLVVHAAGIPAPETSSVSFGQGQTRANNALVTLGLDGIEILADLPGQAHLTLDVNGYFK